jgi:hypothetical protein
LWASFVTSFEDSIFAAGTAGAPPQPQGSNTTGVPRGDRPQRERIVMRAAQERQRYAIRIAEALLLNEGEIAFSEIKAIPFVEDERMAKLVADYLFHNFDVSVTQRRRYDRSGSPLEDIIVLRSPKAHRRSESMKGKMRFAPDTMER